MLVLRYLLNWKVRRIGAYLNIPENTVSVTIRRSLEKIRSRWPEEKETKIMNKKLKTTADIRKLNPFYNPSSPNPAVHFMHA